MRIGEVIAKTGLSRRTIHFYIKEALISPQENPENGYHDFSEEDVENLLLTARLRKLDFSLNDIRTILRFPSTASYYLYRQMDTLTRKIEDMQQNVDCISRFFEEEPGAIDRRSLSACLNMLEASAPACEKDRFTERDGRIIPLFIWAPYITKLRTQYQEFVWDKISRKVISGYQPFLRSMKRIISAVEPARLQYSSEQSSRQAGEIAALSREDTPAYARRMLGQIADFLRDDELVVKWNLVYPSLIHPLLTIGYSEISEMMFELNEEYRRFYDKVCILCGLIWELLTESEEGILIYRQISRKLSPIDWEENGKGELERMSIFSFTPYAMLTKEELKRILFQST